MTGEFRGTAGPWSLCAHLADPAVDSGCTCGYRGVVYGPEPDGYAICQPGHDAPPPGEEGTEPRRYPREVEVANMRAIAAVPEMMKALRFYADKASYSGNGHPQIDADTAPIRLDLGYKARAAIARAVGDGE